MEAFVGWKNIDTNDGDGSSAIVGRHVHTGNGAGQEAGLQSRLISRGHYGTRSPGND